MILIWGWRSRLQAIGEGTFHCPNCQADRQYDHRQARRWFTLFWIPLIPLKVLGTFVECRTCKSGYDERVLTMATNATMADNLSVALRGLVVATIQADGVVTDAERELAIQIVTSQVNHAYGPAELEADLVTFAGHGVADVLGELAGTLKEHGKERLMQTCIALARADGSVEESELEVARQVGAALLMTPAHVRGVIAEALERT
jgi:uncharacterized tellurite resistance protein B-like protein